MSETSADTKRQVARDQKLHEIDDPRSVIHEPERIAKRSVREPSPHDRQTNPNPKIHRLPSKFEDNIHIIDRNDRLPSSYARRLEHLPSAEHDEQKPNDT